MPKLTTWLSLLIAFALGILIPVAFLAGALGFGVVIVASALTGYWRTRHPQRAALQHWRELN